ncbi:TPA: hypothetical protein ACPSKE_002542 [Legionella feeleii]|uniref:Lipoprotein n=1 Tax=Legionella feeleii TaxID=453 RepID=A0A378IVZ9_9GAMM|nr:hypothetical protein [Legionella feeleii]STX38715.1 Uncharacterised protein [Legionella feeleii]
MRKTRMCVLLTLLTLFGLSSLLNGCSWNQKKPVTTEDDYGGGGLGAGNGGPGGVGGVGR